MYKNWSFYLNYNAIIDVTIRSANIIKKKREKHNAQTIDK